MADDLHGLYALHSEANNAQPLHKKEQELNWDFNCKKQEFFCSKDGWSVVKLGSMAYGFRT